MLDVHAPEHPLHTKRDFFLHLFTITIGLLIALGLENAAEAVHHRHQRIEADAQIREEIRSNLKSVAAEETRLNAEIADIVNVMKYVDTRLSGGTGSVEGLNLRLEQSPLRDAAWRTASATAVAQYMNYTTVEGFSECYKAQAAFEAQQTRVLENYLNDQGFVAMKTPDKLTDTELREAIPYLRNTLSSLGGARDLGTGVLQSCSAALQQ